MNLSALLAQANTNNVRVAIALEGSAQWLHSTYLVLRAHLSKSQQNKKIESTLVLSNDERYLLKSASDKLIPPSKFKSCLGSESSLLVWDLLEAVNPDALAATSGTLIGGGVLITLAQPESMILPSAKRWYEIFCECEKTLVLNEENFASAIELAQEFSQEQQLTEPAESNAFQLNHGQRECVKQIEHAATGHRNRPVVIRADRGRGKSTALGFAAAELINQGCKQSIALVSNQRTSIEVLQKHFAQHLQNPEDESKLIVMPSDTMVNEKPPYGLVLVDEAASMPLSVLENIIQHYSRVVLASTQHGYEGSGRGFDLKLQQILERCNKQHNFLTLEEPVRWAPNCALEKSINDAFILNAAFNKLERASVDDTPTTEWLRPEDLKDKEQEIRSIFSLLVLAHYQTRPSDLALLLDNPSLHIAVMRTPTDIAATALCIDEEVPEADDNHLANDIISGKRRLKGRLLPQALASFYADTKWLQPRMLRVMRIVVHPSLQNHGIGSLLLDQVQEYAQRNAFSACSVSFGADAGLLRFWQRGGYRCLRLSYKADASSGLRSAMLVKPLQQQISLLCDQHQGYFYQHLISGLGHFYKNIDPALVAELLTDIDTKYLHDRLNKAALNKLHRFADSMSAPWDCWLELQSLVLKACSDSRTNTHPALNSLIRYTLLGDDAVISEGGGKKAWEIHLREAIRDLLANDQSFQTK